MSLLGIGACRGFEARPRQGSIAVMPARDPRAPARVIFKRLRREGKGGGMTILKDYLGRMRPPSRSGGWTSGPVVLPGELAQCDWWKLPIQAPVGGGASRKVYGW